MTTATFDYDFPALGPVVHSRLSLSRREHQVIAMFAFGYSKKIIQQHLQLSRKQVVVALYQARLKHELTSDEEMARRYRTVMGWTS